jgi:hypothetical protein
VEDLSPACISPFHGFSAEFEHKVYNAGRKYSHYRLELLLTDRYTLNALRKRANVVAILSLTSSSCKIKKRVKLLQNKLDSPFWRSFNESVKEKKRRGVFECVFGRKAVLCS